MCQAAGFGDFIAYQDLHVAHVSQSASLSFVVLRRSLVEQEAAKLDVFGVQRQLREGNCELAAVNLSRESELGELRNQIAIVRYVCSHYHDDYAPRCLLSMLSTEYT